MGAFKDFFERVDAPQNSTVEIARVMIAEFDKYRRRSQDLTQYGGGGDVNNRLTLHLKEIIKDVLGDYLGQPNPSGQPVQIMLSSNQPIMFDNLRQGYQPLVTKILQMVRGNVVGLNQEMMAKALDMAFSGH
jgi:hypothetical protein